MKLPYIQLIWIVFLSSLLACTPLESQPSEYERNNPRSLRRALFQHGKMLLIYGGNDQDKAKYKTWAESVAKNSRRLSIIIKADNEVKEEDITNNPVFFVGSFHTNTILTNIANQIPFHKTDQGFSFEEDQFTEENDIGVLSYYPSPLNPEFPIGGVIGQNDQEVLEFLKKNDGSRIFRSIWGRWGFQVYKNNQRVLLGNFNNDWQPDSLLQWRFNYDIKPTLTTQHYQFFSHSPELGIEQIKKIGKECDSRVESIISFTKTNHKVPKIGFHLYPSGEMMGLMNNRMTQSFVDYNSFEAHAIINAKYEGNFVEQENLLVIKGILGETKVLALAEGLSVYFAPNWQKEGYQYWAAALYRSNNLIPLKDLLNSQYFLSESSLLRSAFSGSLTDFLLNKWGKEKYLVQYQKWDPTTKEIESLEKEWIAYHKTKAELFPKKIKSKFPLTYMKGMTFSHEGYSIYDGYGSKIGAVSLSGIKDIGSNSVAIVPYSGSRSINKPSLYHFSNGAGGENDASVVYAHHTAKSMGLSTLLKPQIYFPGSWPGDVNMQNEEDWDTFFMYYRKWIRHYAMLAEIHDMEAFCIGVEFVKATISHPEKWVELIRDLREIYSGNITYAANWGEEFENLTFAEELDFVGLNFYYPLSSKNKASKKDLTKGLERVLDKVEKKAETFNKPIVLTEIGFRSIAHPWIHPHAEAEDRIGVEKDQALCYEVIFEGIKDRNWCKGLYWWKWPSFIDYAHGNPVSFTPSGKEAELVLRKYYHDDSLID